MKKLAYKSVLKLKRVLCVLTSTALVGTYSGFLANEIIYTNNNDIFACGKVKDDLAYYGGDEGYIKETFSITHFKNSLVRHIDTGHNDKIVVGYSENLTEEQIKQYNLFFDYLNDTFEVINPNYRFYTTIATKNNCDIYIESCSFQERFNFKYKYTATTEIEYNPLNNSKIEGATIYMNNFYNLNNVQQRFILAHEVFHVLTGANDLSSDLSGSVSYPMSVFAYMPNNHIISAIKSSYDPETEKPTSSYSLPMDSEIKESWVSYMPFDLSALVAIYGDSSIEENRQAYLTLLNNKLDECLNLFTDENPFYYEGYTLPKPDNEKETDGENETGDENTTDDENEISEEIETE